MRARRWRDRVLTLAFTGIALAASVVPLSAQDRSRYRTYVLGSPLAEVTAATGTRSADLKTRHERPIHVQQFEWRAPYASGSVPDVDPVEAITFAFVDGLLYELDVTYDRELTKGMTTGDLVGALSATYGAAVPNTSRNARAVATPVPNAAVLARWTDAQADITLIRGPYDDIQLIVRSKELGARATAAIAAALALDAAEAPLRRQQALDTQTAEDLAERTRNRAGFKP